MSKTIKNSDVEKADIGAMPFEVAIKRLETIVEEMESDDLALETLLARYEEGARLAQVCQGKLAEAEVKVQQLEKTLSGEFKLRSFTATPASDE